MSPTEPVAVDVRKSLVAFSQVNKKLNSFFKGSEIGSVGVIDAGSKTKARVVKAGVEIPNAGVVFYQAAKASKLAEMLVVWAAQAKAYRDVNPDAMMRHNNACLGCPQL